MLIAMSRKIDSILVSLLLLSSCSVNVGTPPKSTLRLANGKEFIVVKSETIHFSDGPPALRLVYQTQIPISDKAKLKEEAYEIWGDYKDVVEKQSLTRAILTAAEPSTGALVEKIRSHGFLFEKQTNGEWQGRD
jgi:hypothetical protein